MVATPDERLSVTTAAGALLRSDDGAHSWISLDLDGYQASHLAIGGSTMLADVRDSSKAPDRPGGLYRSLDWGSTWEYVGFDAQAITALAAVGSRAYVGVELPGDRDQPAEVFGTDDLVIRGSSWDAGGSASRRSVLRRRRFSWPMKSAPPGSFCVRRMAADPANGVEERRPRLSW